MFSDGMEEYDNCAICNELFPRPMSSRMTTGQWVASFGPDALERDLWNDLATMDEKHYEKYSKEDQKAMHRGLCSNKCRIKHLNEDMDILRKQLQKAKERIDKLQSTGKTLHKELDTAKDELRKEQELAMSLEKARGYASSELNKITLHPYKYALSQLFPKGYRIKRFFRTNSFAEFVCKYLLILLIGLVLYETISRI